MTSWLSPYWYRLVRSLPLLLLVSFLCALVSYVVASRIGPTHEVHFSYLVNLQEREASEDFRYDGFYALQVTDLFATTLSKWVSTPDVVAAAYARADLALPATSARQLVRSVVATKSAPQLVEVTVRGPKASDVMALTRGLQAVIAERVAQYDAEGIPNVRFTVVAQPAWAGVSFVAVPVIAVGVFVAVFILLVNGVLLLESLRQGGEDT